MEKQKRSTDTLKKWVEFGDAVCNPMDEIIGYLPQRSMSEEFLFRAARSIETVLQDELFVPPCGAALVPARFIVFLNPIDNQSWRGAKRTALQQLLCDITFKRASEMCKPASLSVERIGVTLEEDCNLTQPGICRAVAVWKADSEKAFAASVVAVQKSATNNFTARTLLD